MNRFSIPGTRFLLLLGLRLMLMFPLVPVLVSQPKAFGSPNVSVIKGYVREYDGKPIREALMIAEGKILARTDSSGFFSLPVSLPCQIRCFAISFQDTVLQLTREDSLLVRLHPLRAALDPIIISGTRKRNKIYALKTSLEVIGEQYHIRTQFRIPADLVNKAHRICLQAHLQNETSSRKHWLRPLILDGSEYRTGQLRLHGFDLNRDPLHPWLRSLEHTEEDIILPYRDSVPHLDSAQWKGLLCCYVVDFKNIKHRDSVEFVRGVIDPMRWLQTRMDPVGILDSQYIPQSKNQWHKESGKEHLLFRVNRPELDASDSLSSVRFAHIIQQFRSLTAQNGIKIQRISIRGFASPDGNANRNQRLARQRAQFVYDALMEDRIIQSALSNHPVQPHIDSRVHTWQEVQTLAQATEGKPGKKINFEDLMPYLPHFRYVTYEIDYELYRSRYEAELLSQFTSHPREMSTHDYYQLILYTRADSNKNAEYGLRLLTQAHELFPDEWWFRNELFRYFWAKDSLEKARSYLITGQLSDRLNSQQLSDRLNSRQLTHRLITPTPDEIYFNLALAAWKRKDYPQALQWLEPCLHSSISELHKSGHLLWGLLMALTGHYNEAWKILQFDGGLNRTLLLLAMHRDEEAYEDLRKYTQNKKTPPSPDLHPETPKGITFYLMSICAHRTRRIDESISALREAVRVNSYWKQIALTDGDVMDIVPLLNTHP